MHRYLFAITTLTAALSAAGPAEARRGSIWIPTGDIGLFAVVAIVIVFLIIGGAIKLMRKGAKVVAQQSTSLSREAGVFARGAAEAREETASAWADKLGAEVEQRAANRGQPATTPVASRAAPSMPAARAVRTASLSTGPRSSFGKRG